MADREALQKQYAYHEMSNKVETSKRSRRIRGEPTGEVESLRGRTDVGRMGDRIDDRPIKKLKPDSIIKASNSASATTGRATTTTTTSSVAPGQSILDVNVRGYQPTTASSRAAYERLLTLIGSRQYLSNQTPSILVDAAELVIETLKDDSLRDPERQQAIANVILYGKANPKLTGEQYAQLVQIGKALDDYGVVDKEEDDDMNQEMGVAVVFDESEGEQDSDGEGLVAAVPDSESDDDEDEDEEEGPAPPVDDDEEEQLGGEKKQKVAAEAQRTLTVHEIDAHFLQRQLSKHLTEQDADEIADVAKQVLQVLGDDTDLRACENKLLVLLGFDLFPTIKLFLANRRKLFSVISIKKAQTEEEKRKIEESLQQDQEGRSIWDELMSKSKVEDWSRDRMKGITESLKTAKSDAEGEDTTMEEVEEEGKMAIELDLEGLAFRDGAHTMSNTKVNLPDKSWRAMKKGYEEVHVPAVRSVVPKDEQLVSIQSLPDWTRPAFAGMDKLNRVQSKMKAVALESSENILLCAPTGAGKTNVAMMAMLNVIGRYRKEGQDDETKDSAIGSLDLDKFKIVYVAPMKALVQEVVKNFSSRLKEYGVSVKELSGDSSLTRQQIAETQVLVTTPEKWDIVTRQGEGRAYTQLVRLVIIDEIHLLHDDRGPVLESIVARVIRQVEASAEPIRLVGLSATLPNYADVATFLRVKPQKGLFFFDHSYRPVPLQMQYVGITEKNAFKRFQLQNEICYDRALSQRRHDNQMLIFVHSRAETGKTAKALRDLALERDELPRFVRDGSATQEILREESLSVKNADLKDVLQYGFAIHHAGMARGDRELVEDLFADGHIAVLCCTATLAWGVNLPAHAVIIKGTQIYDPAKGRWAELSPLDVLQMLGRAGRPQYDTEGEGIILTHHSELQYYLSLTNLQLPVESQLIKTLPDHLNAEIVLGTVSSIAEAVDWLSYTFLFVRMLQNPSLYGIHNPDVTLKTDPTLKKRRLDLAHTAATILEKSLLVQYDRKSGSLRSTALGRVASQYYISHSSMAVYSRHMRPNMTDIELLRLFALSGEFSHITVREEEKLELAKLAGKVPIPVKESPSEPSAKVNMLLQAYITRLKLDGFALVADMAFVQQSAARIMRALFEIAVKRNWSGLAKLTLDFSNMVAHRIWRSQTPLRQFSTVPEIVARKLERKSDIEWARYVDLSTSDLGELVGVPKMGEILHKLVHKFPRLDLSAVIQPITRSMLRIELTLVSAFEFDVDVHGYSQLFHVFVEDVNGENILYHQTFTLKRNSDEEEHVLVITVPVMDPLPPAYFIRVLSDRWLHSESSLPISFNHTILPAKFPPPTELLDLQPLPVTSLGEAAFVNLFPFKEFNPVQTQTFHELFKTSRNVIVCAPSGSGKTALADFAILRLLQTNPVGKCVYVSPIDEVADQAFVDWSRRFGALMGANQIVKLTGEAAADVSLVASAKIIVATVKQWDGLSRRWRQRKALHAVSLLVFDELHLLGGEHGPTLEVVISRMRYISSERQDQPIRLVGLGASIANAREVGEWMGVSEKSLFNFSPKVRPNPLEIYFQSYDQGNYAARLMAMSKPVYNAVARHGQGRSVMVFVPSRKQAQLTAIDLMTYQESQQESTFLGKIDDQQAFNQNCASIRDESLKHVAMAGIGFLYEGMRQSDLTTILNFYDQGYIRALICPSEVTWKVTARAYLVIIMGTEFYDGKERRHVDYDVGTLLRMLGRASRHDNEGGKCVLLCHSPKKEYLKKLLYDPLPIESHLDHYLHDHFNSEIVTRTISGLQDAIDYITWTFLYRRLSKNPNYYGLQGTSNVHVSEHLSDMVETVLGDLSESKCCQLDEEGNVSPLNLGMVAAYYYVQYTTVELIAASVTEKNKVRGIMEILANASEFSTIPVRNGEEKTLKIEARTLRHKLPDSMRFNDWSTKTLILLQAHFSRKTLSSEFLADQAVILKQSVTLVQAIVDVISSNGWLKPALAAMELSQMIVQGLWNRDSVLKQIPHFTDEIISRCQEYKGEDPIDSVFDVLNLDDDVRNDLLRLPESKMADVAVFCNNYPNIDVTYAVEDADAITAGDAVTIRISLEREIDEESLDEEELAGLGMVSSVHFPGTKKEGWWIVVGDTSNNSLLSLKRINLKHKLSVQLEFAAPEEPGDYNLTLFCMSDSYMGCDQEYSFNISIAPADDDGEDDSDDDEE
ncbi:Sec63 Brl domain [Fragilaria crotonensis]|nr:Sec63 Brl domain [Fragilaria crotonensis]